MPALGRQNTAMRWRNAAADDFRRAVVRGPQSRLSFSKAAARDSIRAAGLSIRADAEKRLSQQRTSNRETCHDRYGEIRAQRHSPQRYAQAKSLRPLRRGDRNAGMDRAGAGPHLLSLALPGLRVSVRGDCDLPAAGRRARARRLAARTQIRPVAIPLERTW